MFAPRVQNALLFTWSAALTIHPVPLAIPGTLGRLGLGEWLLPLVAFVLVKSVTDFRSRARELRGALAPCAVIAVGLLPGVLFAHDVRRAAVQWMILTYVSSIFAAGYVLAVGDRNLGRPLLGGLVAGIAVRVASAWVIPSVEPWMSTWWPRPLGFAESPNMIALQATVAAFALVVLRPRWWQIGVALFAMTIVATLGHVLFAGLVALAFVTLQILRRRASRRAPLVGLAVFATGVLLIASLRMYLLPVHATPPFINTKPNMYAAAHEIATETFFDRPLTGVGLEGFHAAWRARDDGGRYADRVPEGCEYEISTPLDPHSTWLGYLAEGGLCAGAALVVLVVLAVRAARRRDNRHVDFALAFVGATSVMADVLTNRELALLLGVLLSRAPSRTPSRPGP